MLLLAHTLFSDAQMMMFCIHCSLPWEYETHASNGSVTRYLISLCRPLNISSVDCGLNASVCVISNGHAKSIGNAVEEFDNNTVTENSATKEFILQLEGNQCMDSGQKLKTFIIFKCGKTLVRYCL